MNLPFPVMRMQEAGKINRGIHLGVLFYLFL